MVESRRAGPPATQPLRLDRKVTSVVLKSVVLFVLAAIAEIGGAYLVWIGLRDGRGAVITILGGLALMAYGVIASLQPEDEFGRVLAAYGGVFIAGSLAWGMAFDGFRPDRFDIIGALIALIGVAVIMYSPRGG